MSMRRFLFWLTNRLPAREIKGDNDVPYLERYYLGRLFGFTAYIHRFVASDPGREVHDHPWRRSASVILSGAYTDSRIAGVGSPLRFTDHHAPGINVIKGTDFHRLDLITDDVWSLFIHGKRTKRWGFLHYIRNSDPPTYEWRQHIAREPAEWWITAPKGRDLRLRDLF